jgi:hypothetical protein
MAKCGVLFEERTEFLNRVLYGYKVNNADSSSDYIVPNDKVINEYVQESMMEEVVA